MSVWRLTRYPALDGAGGLLASARWHTKGRRIIYTATSPAGALSEVLVGLDVDPDEIPDGYHLLEIAVDKDLREQTVRDLPDDWRTNLATTRSIGNAWLDRGAIPLLRVPSALIAATENVLIAPARTKPAQLKILRDVPFVFDRRLSAAKRTLPGHR